MKMSLVADVHVGVPGRLEDIMWALRRIRQYNADNDIKQIIILGDLLHNRESININDLCALTDFLEETDKKWGQKITTFPGNHDMFMKNSWEVNSLRPLSRYIDCIFEASNFMMGGCRFWVLPFIHYESEYMNELKKIEVDYKEGDVLLTHIGVKSAILNTCFLLQSWSVVDFTDSKFDRVYTGHFHCTQRVGRNVWYPGSPIPFKFDEGDVDHGFFVFDTDTREHEFVSIWGGKNDENKPPQFLTLDEKSYLKKSQADLKGNIIRIALTSDHTHNQMLDIRLKLENLGAKEVRWMQIASKDDSVKIDVAKQNAASASELFKRYLTADEPDGLDSNFLLKLNDDIVSEGDRRYQVTVDAE